jgi:hypothetical protein
VAVRPGGPWRLWATRASVRWPTMSRPNRTHDRRTSSRRMPVAWSTAVARPPPRPGASRIRSRVSARRASAASRWRRSATFAGVSVLARRPPGRSSTSRSTERPASRLPAIDRPSSRLAGVMTTSHSSRRPRATASTGSKLRDRSSQATTDPCAWASAAVRNASVVRPLEPSPRMATLLRLRRGGCQGQCPEDPRSCGTPASPEARDRLLHITSGGRHRTPNPRTSVLSRQARNDVTGLTRRRPSIAPLPCWR